MKKTEVIEKACETIFLRNYIINELTQKYEIQMYLP